MFKACKDRGVKFIRAGYDGTHITVTSVVSGWIKVASEQEDYTVRPSWVIPAVTVAAIAVAKMMKLPEQETSLDIGEIGIPAIQKPVHRLTPQCKPANRYR